MTKLEMHGRIARLERERDAWRAEAQRLGEQLEAMIRKRVRSQKPPTEDDCRYPG